MQGRLHGDAVADEGFDAVGGQAKALARIGLGGHQATEQVVLVDAVGDGGDTSGAGQAVVAPTPDFGLGGEVLQQGVARDREGLQRVGREAGDAATVPGLGEEPHDAGAERAHGLGEMRGGDNAIAVVATLAQRFVSGPHLGQ